MKKIIAIVLCSCLLILLVGCGLQQRIPDVPGTNTVTQEDGSREKVSPTLAPSNTQSGFDVREPKDGRESFAVDFAEKIFRASHERSSSSPSDFEELLAYVDIDALSPLAPQHPTNFSLGMLIAENCFARVTEYGEIRYADTGIYPTGGGVPKSVGVADIVNITDGSKTVVVIDVREGKLVAILVDVKPAPGGYVASPLDRPEPRNPNTLDMPIVFIAPHSCIVERNGSLVTPVAEEEVGKNDYYELHETYYGKSENISVFCGEAIGTIEGTIIGDTSSYGGSTKGYRGYGYSTRSIRYDVAALAMTHREFRPLRDAITERTQAITTQIGELLDANDKDGFVDMMRGYGELLNKKGAINSIYSGYFTSWQKSDSVHGAEREITINAIEIRGIDSVRVKFTTLLTLASGNKYTADSTVILDYINDEWLIYDMTKELFRSGVDTWKEAE